MLPRSWTGQETLPSAETAKRDSTVHPNARPLADKKTHTTQSKTMTLGLVCMRRMINMESRFSRICTARSLPAIRSAFSKHVKTMPPLRLCSSKYTDPYNVIGTSTPLLHNELKLLQHAWWRVQNVTGKGAHGPSRLTTWGLEN